MTKKNLERLLNQSRKVQFIQQERLKKQSEYQAFLVRRIAKLERRIEELTPRCEACDSPAPIETIRGKPVCDDCLPDEQHKVAVNGKTSWEDHEDEMRAFHGKKLNK